VSKIGELRALAVKARQLGNLILDSQTKANLRSYAEQLEADIERLSKTDTLPAQAIPPAGNEPSTGPDAIAALRAVQPDEE
jgi:hypothetical protein